MPNYAQCLLLFGLNKHVLNGSRFFSNVCQQNDVQAQFELSRLYGDGTYAPVTSDNIKEALFWLKKAAAQDYPPALFSLAFCYKEGNGVEKDLNKAKELLMQAAKQGYKAAKNELESF